MATFKGGFAYIDFEGQAVSTTPITVPGAYALVKTGKPVIFGNIKFDPDLPPTSVCVSMSTWATAAPDSNYTAIFGETFIDITAEDSVLVES